MTIDRRREMRIPLVLPVGCHGFGDEVNDLPKFDLSCYDLSSHGMALACESPIGTDETCRFSLPFFHAQEPLTVKGKIQWRKNLGDGNKIGVRFEEPIDLALPFPVVEDAAARVRQDAEFYKAAIRNVLSDACIWVNSQGNILQYEQRSLTFLDSTDLEVKGKRIFDFVHPKDRGGLKGLFKKLAEHADGSPMKTVVRLQRKGDVDKLCQISVVATSPWSGAVEVYLKDVTQAHRLERRNRLLTEMVRSLSGNLNGTLLVLDPDLVIEDIQGGAPEGGTEHTRLQFRGMAFQKATGLANLEVRGKTLGARLKSCVKTGEAIRDLPVTYWGRPKKGADLFSAGALRLTVTPLVDSSNKVSSLIMVAEAEAPIDSAEQGRYKLNGHSRFDSILGAAASGFLLESYLKEVDRPLIGLVSQLDLLLCKAERDQREKCDPLEGEDAGGVTGDLVPLSRLKNEALGLIQSLRQSLPPVGRASPTDGTDLKTCIDRAIALLGPARRNGDGRISFKADAELPAVKVDERNLVAILAVILLLSRGCLGNVSDKTIRCEAAREGRYVKVTILHNGHIQDEAYLRILFSFDPLQSYFTAAGSATPMETLLHHVASSLKKHHIKMKLINIPGEYTLCLALPTVESSG